MTKQVEQKIYIGNNIDLLKKYPDNFFDSIVTDPPYGLGKEPNAEEMLQAWITTGYLEVKGTGFMGKEWDAFIPQPIFWKEVFRVLKHGGHVVSFFGTRTYDWGVMSMRLAGFEVRDCIQWLYGSGFPKSHNISKAIDKMGGQSLDWFIDYILKVSEKMGITKKELSMLFPSKNGKPTGWLWNKQNNQSITLEQYNKIKDFLKLPFDNIAQAEREVIGKGKAGLTKGEIANFSGETEFDITAPSTDQAKEWDGWGSALKPAHEDLVLARKPFKIDKNFINLYETIFNKFKISVCPLLSFAKDVKKNFLLNQKELGKVRLDFAQWSVEKSFNIQADLFVLMDMLRLELEINLNLSIALSWLKILEDLWKNMNTYTTETVSNMTIDLKILNSLEWESIFQNIIRVKDKKTDGLSANVLIAESVFHVLNLKLKNTQALFAIDNVTLKEKEKNFASESEPIVLARKPLEKGLSIAENVLKWGTGAINIDASRIGTTDSMTSGRHIQKNREYPSGYTDVNRTEYEQNVNGRFPSNVILTHHPECECLGLKKFKPSNGSGRASGTNTKFNKGVFQDENRNGKVVEADYSEETIENWNCHDDCPIKVLDEQSGVLKSGKIVSKGGDKHSPSGWVEKNRTDGNVWEASEGGASRFFYVAKASKSERNFGLESFEEKTSGSLNFRNPESSGRSEDAPSVEKMGGLTEKRTNFHPTVKPVKLMQYLVRMITPPNGTVLDPFSGSGTTGVACKIDGFNFVGLELSEEYAKIAQQRIDTFVEEKEFIDNCKIFESEKNKIETQYNLFD